jgi:hypothetical protein
MLFAKLDTAAKDRRWLGSELAIWLGFRARRLAGLRIARTFVVCFVMRLQVPCRCIIPTRQFCKDPSTMTQDALDSAASGLIACLTALHVDTQPKCALADELLESAPSTKKVVEILGPVALSQRRSAADVIRATASARELCGGLSDRASRKQYDSESCFVFGSA